MNIEDIIHELERNRGRFPRRALQAAIEQREAMTPVLLQALADAADDPEGLEARPDDMLFIYAMYLLAQFREPAAYPLVLRFFSLPGEISLELTGDVVTEDLDRILASICDGDLDPLLKMIESPQINEWVRGSCLYALRALVAEEALERTAAIQVLFGLFQRLPRSQHQIWSNLAAVATDLGAVELLSQIDQAFADGRIDPMYISRDYVHEAIGLDPAEELHRLKERYGFIRDTIAEMEHWATFKPQEAPAPKASLPGLPVRKAPKIGRNDPCPCGSGKKYKKCCLGAG
jgi:hypothetical protein